MNRKRWVDPNKLHAHYCLAWEWKKKCCARGPQGKTPVFPICAGGWGRPSRGRDGHDEQLASLRIIIGGFQRTFESLASLKEKSRYSEDLIDYEHEDIKHMKHSNKFREIFSLLMDTSSYWVFGSGNGNLRAPWKSTNVPGAHYVVTNAQL
jgi:hypothetical protein